MNQHILITGANRGLGAAMARALAQPGNRLTLLCRDRRAGETFMRSLPRGTDSGVLEADLGTLAGIRAATQAIRQLPPVDVLIHNAGIWPQEKHMNADGLEQAFVVNHLAPFLINLELEDMFKARGTRVVQITAGLYPLGDRDFTATAVGANFSAFKTYASTKLLNLATTIKFAERWQGSAATINAVHPGVVRTDLGAMKGLKGAVLRMIKRLWLTPDEGAKAPLFVGFDPSMRGVSGHFYDRFKEGRVAPFLRDRNFLDAVWNQAMQTTQKAG